MLTRLLPRIHRTLLHLQPQLTSSSASATASVLFQYTPMSSTTSTTTTATEAKEVPFFKPLQKSIQENRQLEFSRYAQLATISSQGLPSVRTVTMRGFWESRALVITTDRRSEKLKDLQCGKQEMTWDPTSTASCPTESRHWIELCWYFPLSKEQYRIRAYVYVIDSACDIKALQEFRRDHWNQTVPSTQASFEWRPPGTIRAKGEEGDLDKYEAQSIGPEPSRNFAVLLMFPVRIDYLKLPQGVLDDPNKPQHRESELQPQRQQSRWLHTYDEINEKWKIQELNP